jgi:hypothetical protein
MKNNWIKSAFLDLNLWSEKNWSAFGRQFNKPKQFPLPGHIGLISLTNVESQAKKQQKIIDDWNKFEASIPRNKQFDTIMQAHFMQNTINEERKNEKLRDIYKSFELKSFKCPQSLLKGK